MPLPQEQQRLIIDNLEEFALRLSILITDESSDGDERLIHYILAAKEKYNKPLESWSGYLYRYYRQRGPEADSAITGIQSSHNLITRMKEFLNLVNQGEWNSQSFNTFLFRELIRAVPGYNQEKMLSQEELVRLKELTIRYIVKDLARAEEKEAVAKQNEELQRKKEQKLTTEAQQLEIVDDIKLAKQLVAANPKKTVFLIDIKGSWKWVTPEKMIVLPPTVVSSRLLKENAGKPMSEFKESIVNELKKEAQIALNAFFTRINLLIDPQGFVYTSDITNEFCRSQNICSTFILVNDSAGYQLYWINSLFGQKSISISDYPTMEACLKTFNSESEQDIKQFKTCLLQVDVSMANNKKVHQLVRQKLEALFAQAQPNSASTQKSDELVGDILTANDHTL